MVEGAHHTLQSGSWFGGSEQETFKAWWDSRKDSTDFVGHFRDRLTEFAARHTTAPSITLHHHDGTAFMGLVRAPSEPRT